MKKFTIKSLLIAAALCLGTSAWAQGTSVTETYDFYTHSISHAGNLTLEGDALFQISGNDMKLVSDPEGLPTNGRFAAFTNKNSLYFRYSTKQKLPDGRYSNTGLFCNSGKTAYFSILNLKDGDIINIDGGSLNFVDITNVKLLGDDKSETQLEAGSSITSGANYIIRTSDENTRLDIKFGGYGVIRVLNITTTITEDKVSNPQMAVTATKGNSRFVTITPGESALGNEVKTYYTIDGSEPSASSTLYAVGTPVEVNTSCTIKAISIAGDVSSNIVSLDVVAGTPSKLPAPTVVMTDISLDGKYYNASFSGSTVTKDEYGNETGVTLSYTFTPTGDSDVAVEAVNGYTVKQDGTFNVIASADGYASSTASLRVYAKYLPYYESYKYNEITEDNIATVLGENWTKQNTTSRWAGWSENGAPYTYYAHTGGSGSVWNYTIDNLQLRSVVQLNLGGGLGRNSNEAGSYLKNLEENKLGAIYMYDGSLKNNYYKLCFIGNGQSQNFFLDAGDVIQQVVFYTGVETVSISAAGYATFSSTYAVDFSKAEGLTAYTATVSDNKVVMTPIENGIVPANTGVILKGAAGNYIITTTEAVIENNDLVAATEEISSLSTETTVDEVTYKNYILNVVNEKPGFYLANNKKVAAGKAYLRVSAEKVAGAKALTIVWNDGETTGIEENYEFGTMNSDAATYDLSGRKVANPAKGLYIKNGKKFIVK